MEKRMKDASPQAVAWVDSEFSGSRCVDVRLERRLKTLATRLSDGVGDTIPMACQDWAATKAAYRFFSNDRVTEEDILSGHFQATRDRFRATEGLVFVLHDTTEFSFQREKKEAIGVTHRSCSGKNPDGRPRLHTICGVNMHSSLVVTLEGLPLGLSAVKFWTRKKFKGSNALGKRINRTRIPIDKKESVCWIENVIQANKLLGEPGRCVHIGDRGSDIYELFCAAKDIGTHFLLRTCVNRLAGDGTHTISDEMRNVPLKGTHSIDVRDNDGNPCKAVLEIRYHQVRVLPPIGKQSRYPEHILTVIYAQEKGTPEGREKIDWKLITDLPVKSLAEAIEKLEWYASRWKIETFHKILKSGCKVEDSKLRTAERLLRLIAVFCILSWRIFWMTMVNRTVTSPAAETVFTTTERRLLDHLVPDRQKERTARNSLSSYIVKIARLGGYLDRSSDPPPGNIVMWRGLSKFTDIERGFSLAQLMGN
jgi:Transposase DNA-binding/Transposase Tn5 dimerisation domain